jgi:hypothetical protein
VPYNAEYLLFYVENVLTIAAVTNDLHLSVKPFGGTHPPSLSMPKVSSSPEYV